VAAVLSAVGYSPSRAVLRAAYGSPHRDEDGYKLARYRLRFVLQEVDLPRGVTIIGRSLDCHLTIEDPLVSRRHAQIVVTENSAQIEDLGSRNGVKVNGAVVAGVTPLRSGDRLRIGTQELIFSRVEDPGRSHARTTGQLRLCANCRQPYPREMVSCPTCEATEQTDDETLTVAGGESHRWTVQLFVEALERAMRLGRAADAEQLLRRATLQVDELVASGRAVDTDILLALATHATAPALASHDPGWSLWALEIFAHNRRAPSMSAVENLAELAARYPARVPEACRRLLVRLGPAVDSASEADALVLARLRELGGPDAAEATDATDAFEGAEIPEVPDTRETLEVPDAPTEHERG
jgi:hypothetical protein